MKDSDIKIEGNDLITGFGFCVWLLIHDQTIWEPSRKLYNDCYNDFPLHITIKSHFNTYEEALNFKTKYLPPSHVTPTKLINRQSCVIDNISFHSLEIVVNADGIDNAHMSLAYNTDKPFKLPGVELYEVLPNINKKYKNFSVCIADLRCVHPNKWIIYNT